MMRRDEQKRLAELVKKRILARFRSVREFSLRSGFSYALLSKLLSGKARFNLQHLVKIAEALGVPVYQLLSEEPLLPVSRFQEMLPAVQEKYRLVPKVSPAACGASGIIPSEEVEDWLAFKEEFLRRFKNPIVTTAVGDSMEPLIYDGDVLLIDRDENKRVNPDRRKLYLVNFPQTMEEVAITVKRIAVAGDKLFLIPINPDYPVQETDIKDRTLLDFIIGEVVWIGRVIE